MLLLGTFAIYLSLFAGVLSILGYIQAANGNMKKLFIGRIGLNVSALGIFLASMVLMTNIFQHNFENAYVWSYSSRDLSSTLLFSTFWAGQEGSFLFWTFCSALLSIFLLSYTRKRKLEEYVLPIFLAVQSFLVLLLIVKSPFKSIYEQFPGELSPGQLPNDGKGLNPLLQNFWMVIHPPVLFIGFAITAIPFSFAIAALWKKEYSSWLTNAFPWVLFSALALGAGLMLGAYWAYGVLGWGGYWGWDPVENSSLVPWILSMSLLHTMLAQVRTGHLVRTNFAFAILQFVLVIYSTFLTRSGILSESSVHSFSDPGMIVYSLLVVFLTASFLLGAGFLFLRRAELKAIAQPMHWMTREFALSIGSFVLLASAAIVFFGTSLPIVSSTQVEASFYNRMHLPIAILMTLLIGYSLLIRWDVEDGRDLLTKAWKSLTASLIGTVGIAYFSMWEISYLLFIFSSLFAIFVNLEQLVLIIRGDIRMMGGKIAHIGIGVFLIGVIISGLFDKKETAMLELGTTQNVLGYSVTYTGKNVVGENKTAYSVSVLKDGNAAVLVPTMIIESDGHVQMRNPDIQSFFTHDFYVSPSGIEEQKIDPQGNITLLKEESVKIGSAMVTFTAFDMAGHNTNSTEGGAKIGVKLEIKSGYEKETVIPYVINKGGHQEFFGAESKLLGGKIEFLAMNIGGMGGGKSAIQIQLKKESQEMAPMQHKEILIVEASVKPFINLVWIGTVLVLFGFFLAILRRKLADSK
jgi:cytochrome c-type biogenesis protein CcmF